LREGEFVERVHGGSARPQLRWAAAASAGSRARRS
jgi:hypothetical protein